MVDDRNPLFYKHQEGDGLKNLQFQQAGSHKYTHTHIRLLTQDGKAGSCVAVIKANLG